MIRPIFLLATTLVFPLAASQTAVACADDDAATTQPANPPSAVVHTASLDRLLDGLDARGKNLSTLEAGISKSEVDVSLGEDTETRMGRLVYERKAEGDVRIRVSLDKLKIGEKERPDRIEYMLADGVLFDRNYRSKVEAQRIVQRPGQKLDLFKLGQGPFPLPIGQPKESVYEQFEVSELPAAADDPAGTAHVKLVPKPDTDLARKFASIDVWVDQTDFLPRRIETINPPKSVMTRTDLSDVKLNAPLGTKVFELEKISDKEWAIRIEAD